MSQGTSEGVLAAVNAAEVAPVDPDYITYLLDPKEEYNCYFLVGNAELENIERIGVVKKMLLAHSLVLRAELQDSKIAEKNDVKVNDLFPETFKNLLRWVYGYDNVGALSFDEADNLLYAAEKYMVTKLKNTLASHLASKLDYTNICSLMNNPACFTVLELDSAITYILQTETDNVLASPQFLDLSPYGFQKILEQEMCNIDEIDLWRAAIGWAKNRGESEDGESLRNELNSHLHYIRVCAMSSEEVLSEVVPTKVLKYDELVLVGESCKTGEIQPDLTTICNVVEKRDRPLSELLEQSLRRSEYHCSNRITESTFKLKTQDNTIELCSVFPYPYNLSSHQCNCTISITKDTQPPIVVRFEGQVDSASKWAIPIVINEKNLRLQANSSYSITFSFTCSQHHYGIYPQSSPYGVSGNHFSIDFQPHSNGHYIFQVDLISYKVVLYKTIKPIQNPQ